MTCRLNTIVLEGVAVYLLHRPGEAILIDSGRRGSAPRILSKMQKFGIEPSMLKWIILTHAHFDHAGSARKLQELTGCKIAVHSAESRRLLRGRGPIPSGTRPRARRLSILGKIFMPWIMFFPGVKADLELEGDCKLEDFGFPGRIIHTPGHSPSSLSIILDNGEALVGDILREEDEDVIGIGMFYEDEEVLLESLEKIASYDPKVIYLSHGTHIDHLTFGKAIERIQIGHRN